MSPDHEQPPPAVAPPDSIRRLVVFSALAAAVALFVGAQYQQMRLEQDVAPLMQKHIDENKAPGVDVAAGVTATRDGLFFGTPRARIEVFMRPSGDGDSDHIGSIEYQYAMEEGQWRLTDSGSCTDDSCQIRGQKVFEAQ